MPEIALVLLALLAIGLLGLATTLLTPQLMTTVGLWTLLFGLVVGIPTGLWYHVVLYRFLSKKIVLPSRWWWAPVDLHPHLAQEELARIKPWFVTGGVGFLLSLAGGLAAMAGLLLNQ
ncbi:MAG: hypothetical protein EPO61_02565 [Nitrospirae bacterium]|nr:MAG: hypothetical protein EPO61_02565 [Nitrospirota bacterium]